MTGGQLCFPSFGGGLVSTTESSMVALLPPIGSSALKISPTQPLDPRGQPSRTPPHMCPQTPSCMPCLQALRNNASRGQQSRRRRMQSLRCGTLASKKQLRARQPKLQQLLQQHSKGGGGGRASAPYRCDDASGSCCQCSLCPPWTLAIIPVVLRLPKKSQGGRLRQGRACRSPPSPNPLPPPPTIPIFSLCGAGLTGRNPSAGP